MSRRRDSIRRPSKFLTTAISHLYRRLQADTDPAECLHEWIVGRAMKKCRLCGHFIVLEPKPEGPEPEPDWVPALVAECRQADQAAFDDWAQGVDLDTAMRRAEELGL